MRIEPVARHLLPPVVLTIATYMAVIVVRGIVEWFA